MAYKVAKFYGYRPLEVFDMDYREYVDHVKAMEQLEAQDILTKLKISDYPNNNEDSRKKFHKQISKRAFPNPKVYKFDDIEKALGLR